MALQYLTVTKNVLVSILVTTKERYQLVQQKGQGNIAGLGVFSLSFFIAIRDEDSSSFPIMTSVNVQMAMWATVRSLFRRQSRV
jgi:hypothetical protein